MTSWPNRPLGSLAKDERGAITDGPFGSHLTSAHYTSEGPLVVRLQNIGDGVFRHAAAHISEAHYSSLSKHQVVPGDLLVASLGENLPRACLAPSELGPAIVKADCIRVRLSDDVEPRWVMHALQRPEARRWAEEHLHGVGRPRLGLKLIREIPVPLPPLTDQLRIVDILEDHLSRLDAANDYLATTSTRVDAWRQSAVDAEFFERIERDPDDGTPRTLAEERHRTDPGGATGAPCIPDTELLSTQPWPVVSLEAATDAKRVIRYGILKPRVHVPGTVPYVEVKDLAGYSLEGKSLHRTSAELDSQFRGARLTAGDVLIAVRGSYERTAVVPLGLGGANISRDVARIAPLPSMNPEFLWWWLQSSTVKRYLRRHARGVAVKGVNISTLRALPVPAVPMSAQVQLVRRLADVAATSTRINAEVGAARLRGGALRRALLTAAFTGRLTGRSSDLELAEEIAAAQTTTAAASERASTSE